MANATTAPVSCPDTGDTAFMFMCTVLVLSMVGGLGFFESGLLRRRSALSVIVQCFCGLSVMYVLWFMFGFSAVYGPTVGGIIGNPGRYAFFLNLTNGCLPEAPAIPGLAFATFQMQFAAITPLLMTGAFAERIRMLGFLPFIIVWEILVYYPIAHMIWGDGWMAHLGVLDFAGGITIHETAGVGAVVCAVVMGKRDGFDDVHGHFPSHNVPLAAIGASQLLVGWLGFNGGSAQSIGFLAIQAMTNTVVAAATSAVTWSVISIISYRKRVDPVYLLSGLVAGLAGITPCSGYVETWAAAVIGLILGVTSFFFFWLMKAKLHIDDALDVSSVHGIPGIVGALMIGFFGSTRVNPQGADGVFYGSGRQLWVQCVAVVVTGAWTLVVTLPWIWWLNRFGWFKLSASGLKKGLDFKDLGVSAYSNLEEENTVVSTTVDEPRLGSVSVYTRTTMNMDTLKKRDMGTPLLAPESINH